MSEYFGHYLNPNSPEAKRKREAERKRTTGYPSFRSVDTDNVPTSFSSDIDSSSSSFSCDSGGFSGGCD